MRINKHHNIYDIIAKMATGALIHQIRYRKKTADRNAPC